MNEVKRHVVSAEESGMRLDRWFKVHFCLLYTSDAADD